MNIIKIEAVKKGGILSTPQIIIKSDIEHIRLRPGMYIGSTFDPNHLLQEIIDNSLDELINNYADELRVDFISTSHVIITDNGRGIPVHEIELEGGLKEISIIAASTRLKSGAKFDNDAYEHSIGLHGIGLVAVNALSKEMRITVRDQHNKYLFHDVLFNNSELVNYQTVEDKTITWSTRIEFEVDPQYFTIGDLSQPKVVDQFKLTHAKFPNTKLFVNNEQIVTGTMENFVREQLEIDSDIPLFRWDYKTTTGVRQYGEHSKVELVQKPVIFDIWFTYDINGAMASNALGDVNLRMCTGRYLTNFNTILANAIKKQYECELSKNEVLSHLRVYISCFIPNPEFDSQSKTNMSKDIKSILEKGVSELERIIISPFIKQVITELNDRKTLKKVNRKVGKTKGRVSSKNPLKDCLKIPGKTLWLLEGESAMGNLLKIRNVREEAVYPLTGKILNVVSKTLSQVADSKKFRFLFEALGAEIGNRDQSDYRYEEIKILCDADPDGHHIVVLLLMGIWYYFPHFLNNGKVTIIVPPLYGAYDKGKFIPIYSAVEAAKYKNYRRYKGIGEMNDQELKTVIRGGGVEYIPKPPTSKREADALIRCLDDTDVKRRLCLEKDRFNIENLFIQS